MSAHFDLQPRHETERSSIAAILVRVALVWSVAAVVAAAASAIGALG